MGPLLGVIGVGVALVHTAIESLVVLTSTLHPCFAGLLYLSHLGVRQIICKHSHQLIDPFIAHREYVVLYSGSADGGPLNGSLIRLHCLGGNCRVGDCAAMARFHLCARGGIRRWSHDNGRHNDSHLHRVRSERTTFSNFNRPLTLW